MEKVPPPPHDPKMGNVDNHQFKSLFDESADEKNPLMLPVVLDNLLQYVTFKDLKTYRLVCGRWFQVSLTPWLKKAPALKLSLTGITTDAGGEGDSSGGDDGGGGGKWKSMSTFLSTARSHFHSYGDYEYNGLRRFQQFELGESNGGRAISVKHQLPMFEMFFVTSGEWITNLTLSVEFPDLPTYQAVMLSKFTPNLVELNASFVFSEDVLNFFQVGNNFFFESTHHDNELGGDHTKLNCLQVEGGGGGQLPQSGWMQLLRRYPKLRTLLIGVDDYAEEIEANRMLDSISAIREREEDPAVLDLKSLGMYCECEPPYTKLLGLLRQKRLILQELGVTIGGNIPNETIVEILASQATTLKVLWICTPSWTPREMFHPPRLDLVTTLDLFGFPFRRLTFLKSFTNLKSLSIRGSHIQLLEEDMMPIFAQVVDDDGLGELVISTLSQFHCDYEKTAAGSFSPEDIQKLGRVMPKLTDLQCWLTNDSFRQVCKTWPDLEQLHIIGNEVDDEGITGVVDGGERIIKENISVFQELKSLKMTYEGWKMRDFAKNITFQSALNGFNLLPNLQKVEIGDKEFAIILPAAARH